jgi:acyl-CoA dehydrogenase
MAGERSGARVAIIQHPDVRRMLANMKARIKAMRTVAYSCATTLDIARLHPEPGERARHAALADLMVPVVKGWCTEWGVRITSIGLQVHGGMDLRRRSGGFLMRQGELDDAAETVHEGI